MFESEIFRKEIYCIEECTCDTVGIFRRHLQSFGVPQWFGAWRIVPSLPPRYAPGQGIILYTSSNFLFDTTQRCGGTQKRTGMLAEIDVFQLKQLAEKTTKQMFCHAFSASVSPSYRQHFGGYSAKTSLRCKVYIHAQKAYIQLITSTENQFQTQCVLILPAVNQ